MGGTPPRAIGFDYGGTLIGFRSPAPGLAAAEPRLRAVLSASGGAPAGGEPLGAWLDAEVERGVAEGHRRSQLREVDIGTIYSAALQRITGRELEPELVWELCLIHQRAWMDALVPAPGAKEALSQLRGRGIALGLCSNAPYPPELMREQLRRLGFDALLDVAVFTSEVGWRKPSPLPFRRMLEGMGAQPRETWFVGDELQADLVGSSALGMRPLLAPGASAPDFSGTRLSSWEELVAMVDSDWPLSPPP